MKTKLLLLISIIIIMFQTRLIAATYTVTNTNDSGAGSLRQAILDANASVGVADEIIFNLGPSIPYTITLTSQLPDLTDNAGVLINGYNNSGKDGTLNTVPVFNATPTNQLNHVFAVIIANGANINKGLVLASNNNIIRGLVLQDFGDGVPDNLNLNDVGIEISGNNNQVQGCYIGVDYTGTTKGTKTYVGIHIKGNNNTIGTGIAATANLISGMNGFGRAIRIDSVTGNVIKGNMIGLQKNGTSLVTDADIQYGIQINASNGNTIGGSNDGDGNVISGHKDAGIGLTNASGNSMLGNRIGPSADGATYVIGNVQLSGIALSVSTANIIGGTGVYEKNIISANVTYGILVRATDIASGINNVIKGNYIGPSVSLTSITGASQTRGIYFARNINSCVIGGTTAAEGNIIAFNTIEGMSINGDFSGGQNYNNIRQNLIYSNPVAIGHNGPANESKAAPVITNWSTTKIIGTTTQPLDIIELYKNATSAAAENASAYLGTVTASAIVNGSGTYNWDFDVPFSTLTEGEFIVATATNVNGSTSQLGKISSPVTLPIELIDFNATCNYNNVIISWSTASETNNDFFTIERTTNGVDNLTEFIIVGAGNSSSVNKYTIKDNNPLPGISYYRLKQTDFDGKYEYFKYVAASCNDEYTSEINVYPNPSNGSNINISISNNKQTEILVVLYDINGKMVYSKVNILEVDGGNIIAIDLQERLVPGIYFITASSNNKIYNKKLIVE